MLDYFDTTHFIKMTAMKVFISFDAVHLIDIMIA